MQVDIRTKLLIVAIFSALALVYQNPLILGIILLLNLLTVILFRVPLQIFREFKGFIYMYAVLMVIRAFVRDGNRCCSWVYLSFNN